MTPKQDEPVENTWQSDLVKAYDDEISKPGSPGNRTFLENEISELFRNHLGRPAVDYDMKRHADSFSDLVARNVILPSVIPPGEPAVIGCVILIDCDATALQVHGAMIDGLFFLGTDPLAIWQNAEWPPEILVLKKGLFGKEKPVLMKLAPDSLKDYHPVKRTEPGSESRETDRQDICLDSSNARGLCFDGSEIKSIIGRRTNLRGLSARGITITGACSLKDCRLDGLRLTDYRIQPGGALYIGAPSSAKYRIISNAVVWTTHATQGELHLCDAVFNRCLFSRPGATVIFSPSKLERVRFEDCDFDRCTIRPRSSDAAFVFRFSHQCSLRDTRFENIKGTISITHARNARISISESDAIDQLDISSADPVADPLHLKLETTRIGGLSLVKQHVTLTVRTGVTLSTGRTTGEAHRDMSLRESTVSNTAFRNIAIEGSGQIDFTGAVFKHCDFSGMRMRQFVLKDTVFDNCNLDGCHFDGNADGLTIKGNETRLAGACFGGEEISRLVIDDIPSEQISACDFDKTRVIRGEFKNLIMVNLKASTARFVGCLFADCVFDQCLLDGTAFEEVPPLPGSPNGDGHRCRFINVDFSKQGVLRNVSFDGVEADSATTFMGCHFESCSFGDKHLYAQSSVFDNTVFIKCKWERDAKDLRTFPFASIAEIRESEIREADLANGVFRCKLKKVKLVACNLRDVSFRSAILQDVEFEGHAPNEIGTRLVFKENCRIDDLSLRQLNGSSSEVTFIDCNDIQNLNISDCNPISFAMRSCSVSGLAFEHCTAAGFEIGDTLFSGKMRFVNASMRNNRYERCNLLEAGQDAVFLDTDINGTTFSAMKLSCALSDVFPVNATTQGKEHYDNLRFESCDFTGASLDQGLFIKAVFDAQCDLSNIRKQTVAEGDIGRLSCIRDADFTNAQLLANINHVCFVGCKFPGTDFTGISRPDPQPQSVGIESGPGDSTSLRRKLVGCRFVQCAFSGGTRFDGLEIYGGYRRPKVFIDCDGMDALTFRKVLLNKIDFGNFDSSQTHELELADCVAGHIALRSKETRLVVKQWCKIAFLELCNVTLTREDDIQLEYSEIDKLVFDKCTFTKPALCKELILCPEFLIVKRMEARDPKWESVHFYCCRFSSIGFSCSQVAASCSANESADGIGVEEQGKPHAPAEHTACEPCCFLKKIKFENTLFIPGSHGGDLFYVDDRLKPHCEVIEIKYFMDGQAGGSMHKMFNKPPLSGSQVGDMADFMKKTLPIENKGQDVVQYLRDMWEDPADVPGLNAIRHADFKYSREIIEEAKANKVFEVFRDKMLLKGKTVLSSGTNKRAVNLANELCGTEDNEMDFKRRFSELKDLMYRSTKDPDGDRLSFRDWIVNEVSGESDLEIIVPSWPEENRRVFIDYGLFGQILNRIAKNAIDHAVASSFSIHGSVVSGVDPAPDGTAIFIVRLSDNGAGVRKDRESLKAWILESDLGRLIQNFSRLYCERVRITTTTAVDHDNVSFAVKGNDIEEVSVDNGFNKGTALEFQITLPVVEARPREVEL